jgi:quinoprotein glucose dehydrogenase
MFSINLKISLLGSLVLCTLQPLGAQSGATNGEWRFYAGDPGNTHYSPLDQINGSNFNKLRIAWRFNTEHLGPRPEYNLEATPLMVHGVVYVTAGTRRDVVALDAGTGELLWVHSEDEGQRGIVAPRQTSRGLAYWTDGREERILYVTAGYRLIALNAKTGNRIPGFGQDGFVDLKQGDDQVIDPLSGDIGLNATPVVGGDVVIVGAAHKSGAVPRSKRNVKGYVRGFDVRTGKRLWIFHTVPKPGEFGYDTWEKDSADYTGNTGAWGQVSIDEQLGIAFLPVELPTGDYYGGHRLGNGLFGETLVAVDLKTGQRKWHFQLVHHGIWDLDIPCAPMLIDITQNGRTVKAVAQPTKQAFLYVFDRVTGKPIWPIEERPVPPSDVPGEKTSLTQPFPTKPPAYELQGSAIDDLIDFTPELRAEAVKIVSKYKIGPIFTPPVVENKEGPIGTLAAASSGSGGTNWAGGSYDPETHIAYLPSQRILRNISLIPGAGRSDMAYVYDGAAPGTGVEGAGSGLQVKGLPADKPPYGSIVAIDMNKGEILWRIAHGETPNYIRNNPALKGVNIPRTGRPGVFGVLVTKTLIISGERGVRGESDAMLRAYDKATGKELGAVPMPAGETGTPMTYMHNGRQYIVLAVGGGFPSASDNPLDPTQKSSAAPDTVSAELVAYSLPD